MWALWLSRGGFTRDSNQGREFHGDCFTPELYAKEIQCWETCGCSDVACARRAIRAACPAGEGYRNQDPGRSSDWACKPYVLRIDDGGDQLLLRRRVVCRACAQPQLQGRSEGSCALATGAGRRRDGFDVAGHGDAVQRSCGPQPEACDRQGGRCGASWDCERWILGNSIEAEHDL